MIKPNFDIRLHAYELGIPLWKVADALEISEGTVMRILRRELTDIEKQMFIQTIDWLHRGEKTKSRKEWLGISHSSKFVDVNDRVNYGNRKLSEDDVFHIRKTFVKGHRSRGMNALAKKYGVSPSTIYYIVHHITWNNFD